MPIIRQKEIYDPSKGNPVEQLTKDLQKLLDIEKQLTEQNKKWSESLQMVKKSGDGAEAKKLVTYTEALKKSTSELTAVQKERIRIDKEREKILAKLITVDNKQNQINQKGKIQLQELTKLQKLQIQINKSQVGSIERLRLETRKLAIERDKLGNITGKNAKQFQQLTSQINKNNTILKNHGKAVNDNTRNVGNYRSALKGLGTQLLGAAGIVGGVQLLIQGFTALRDRAIVLNKATRKIANTFDISRKAAKGLAADITALANNFDKDYNEILNSANAVSKEFDISASQALAHIEEGLKKGSDNSGEFLDILREYPAQLQSVGLSADESFALINQQVKAGVYSDKGIDAIKEAGINIRQNTKAFKDAIAPIEEGVKAEIKREQAAGNTFKAMQLIAGELKNLNQEQKQTILSDIFRGAGEDALTFVESLDEVELSLEGVASQTSRTEDAQLQLSKTYNSIVGKITDTEGVLGGFFSRVWAGFIDLLSGAIAELERFLEIIGLVEKESQKQTKAIDDIAGSIEKQNTEQGKNNELTKEQIELSKKAQEQYQKDLDYLDAYIKKLEEERRAEIALDAAEIKRRKNKGRGIVEQVVSKFVDVRETTDDEESRFREKQQKEIDDRRATLGELDEMNTAWLQKKGKDEADQILKSIEFEKKAKETLFDTINQIGLLQNQQRLDAEINQIQSQRSIEEAILKNKLDKGLINEIQYQTRLAEVNRQAREKEARAEKRKAIFDIAVQGAVAFVSGLVRGGIFSALRNAALVAAKALAVAAVPLPKFEKGTEFVKRGDNPAGTDTIPAMINEGERIVPTHINKMLNGVPNEALPKLIRSNDSKELAMNNKKLDTMITLLSNGYSAYTLGDKAFLTYWDGSGNITKTPEKK